MLAAKIKAAPEGRDTASQNQVGLECALPLLPSNLLHLFPEFGLTHVGEQRVSYGVIVRIPWSRRLSLRSR